MANASNDAAGLREMVDKVRETAAKNPATERLLSEVEDYLAAVAQRALGSVGSKLGELTSQLTDVAEGRADPSSLLGRTAKEMGRGTGPGKAVAKAGVKSIGDRIKGLFRRGGGSGGGRSMKIVEDVDVGVPVHVAYNQWTRLQDVPRWSKGAQAVNQEDAVTSTWKAKVFWSTRNWTAKINEQVPDERISWSSEGAKGVVNGVVTFHPLGENLTRILVGLEYIPGGLFEKAGNLWRAQGRRARLDLKMYRQFVMMNTGEEPEGWRGEIREGEVVREHDEGPDEEPEGTEPYDDEDYAEDEESGELEPAR